jgi:hypothetical protein
MFFYERIPTEALIFQLQPQPKVLAPCGSTTLKKILLKSKLPWSGKFFRRKITFLVLFATVEWGNIDLVG